MTVPDPDEQDRRRPAGGRGSRGADPAATDAAFAEIVAGWRNEPDVPCWPTDAEATDGTRGQDTEPVTNDDYHYLPPEPPPMPALRPRTLGGLALIALGVLVLLAPGVVGLVEGIATPLGLLAAAGGLGWLVLGLRTGPPPDSGWDDGAQL